MNTTAAYYLAQELMEKHGLFEDGWKFEWSRGKRQFGVCKAKRKRINGQWVYTSKTIALSAPLTELNDEKEVKDTILHEIAHALAGFEAGHGPAWQAVARRIGAKPNRCADPKTTNSVPHKYEVVCGVCLEVTSKKHRRVRTERRYHPKCGMDSLGKMFLRKVG